MQYMNIKAFVQFELIATQCLLKHQEQGAQSVTFEGTIGQVFDQIQRLGVDLIY